MNYLERYLTYNQNNECPKNYHIWAALTLLSAVVLRKVRLERGYFTVYPNLYTCLVGVQGNGKTVAKDIARDMYTELFPDMPVSGCVMTREAITKFLGSEESMRVYTDETQEAIEYHPYIFFINELKNFLSVNPAGMLDFLTDIYDRAKKFEVITKNQGTDTIINPSIVMLACETPEWIVERLKEKVISGGFSRRVIYVYELDENNRIPFPEVTEECKLALKDVHTHLLEVSKVVGKFEWSADARKWFEHWYMTRKFPEDTAVRGYFRTRHVQLLKAAMLVCMCKKPFRLVLEEEHLVVADKLLGDIEVNLPRLFSAAGRNEMAFPTTRIMDFLNANNGKVLEKNLLAFAYRDLAPYEVEQVMKHLERTEEIEYGTVTDPKGVVRRIVLTTKAARAIKDRQALEKVQRQKGSGGPAASGASVVPPSQPPAGTSNAGKPAESGPPSSPSPSPPGPPSAG